MDLCTKTGSCDLLVDSTQFSYLYGKVCIWVIYDMVGLPDSGTGGLVGDDLLHLVDVDGYLLQASLLLLWCRVFDEMPQKDFPRYLILYHAIFRTENFREINKLWKKITEMQKFDNLFREKRPYFASFVVKIFAQIQNSLKKIIKNPTFGVVLKRSLVCLSKFWPTVVTRRHRHSKDSSSVRSIFGHNSYWFDLPPPLCPFTFLLIPFSFLFYPFFPFRPFNSFFPLFSLIFY